ncbi:MAG: aldo/keto reductase, partial [Sedimentibacter sp.]|uniref:aldo/keto reductase n=1 Tax=Sedimentibacter sp. TaxID=1960295 RepID=UPI002981238E
MDKKFIEKFNATLPKLGFGCMRFPVKDNKIDFDAAKEMIHYAMDNGLNYFDTAYNYHNGESQEFLGKVLSEFERESYYLTNKLPVWKVKEEADAE